MHCPENNDLRHIPMDPTKPTKCVRYNIPSNDSVPTQPAMFNIRQKLIPNCVGGWLDPWKVALTETIKLLELGPEAEFSQNFSTG
jgi:hypothetical protein